MGGDAKSAFGLGRMVRYRDSADPEISLSSGSHVAVPVGHFFRDHHYR